MTEPPRRSEPARRPDPPRAAEPVIGEPLLGSPDAGMDPERESAPVTATEPPRRPEPPRRMEQPRRAEPPPVARPNGAPPAGSAANGGDPARPFEAGADLGDRAGCTAPQLRRFIKSRAYVPMHELRRRFAIEGTDDDVTQVDLVAGSRVYVGLPTREGLLLGELLRAGDVGYELSLDPISPIVVGVFPMRPVPRV